MYYVYILKSKTKNRHYIGSTSDIKNRVEKHNAGGVQSTKPFRPWVILGFEKFFTRSEARKREIFLKKTAKARVELFVKLEHGVIV
jgi:putative endonuclease